MIRHDERPFPFEILLVVDDEVSQVLKVSVRPRFLHFNQELVVQLDGMPSGSREAGIREDYVNTVRCVDQVLDLLRVAMNARGVFRVENAVS